MLSRQVIVKGSEALINCFVMSTHFDANVYDLFIHFLINTILPSCWNLLSSPAIEDLKRCLEYTGQHSKLVDSFISSLKYRLLTAGASTNDILHQYVSTIKALRTVDPAGVFLEAVGEPIRDYLRGRKDTIKCIVTMLTDGTGGNSGGSGNAGDSLLEELNRDAENQDGADFEEDAGTDEKQSWLNAERCVIYLES
jgi:anaphase-promoting complex subunit 2